MFDLRKQLEIKQFLQNPAVLKRLSPDEQKIIESGNYSLVERSLMIRRAIGTENGEVEHLEASTDQTVAVSNFQGKKALNTFLCLGVSAAVDTQASISVGVAVCVQTISNADDGFLNGIIKVEQKGRKLIETNISDLLCEAAPEKEYVKGLMDPKIISKDADLDIKVKYSAQVAADTYSQIKLHGLEIIPGA